MMKLMSGRWKYQCHAVYPHRQYAKVVGSPVLSVSVSVLAVWVRSKLLTSFEVCPLARDTGTVNISFFCSSLSVSPDGKMYSTCSGSKRNVGSGGGNLATEAFRTYLMNPSNRTWKLQSFPIVAISNCRIFPHNEQHTVKTHECIVNKKLSLHGRTLV
jgi:hypothetical protein